MWGPYGRIPKPSKDSVRSRVLRALRDSKRPMDRTEIGRAVLPERFTLEQVDELNRTIRSLVDGGMVRETKTEKFGAPLWTYEIST